MGGFLKISGNYTDWNIYKKSVIICDVTEMFINRALPRGTRTIDQMRQAARSCKQNIVEGISDSTVSIELCLKLIGVARGSARELLEDYRDYLRQNCLEIWDSNDDRTIMTRVYCIKNDEPIDFTAKCRARSNETVANIMLTQIHQLDSMLSSLLKKIEAEFIALGGIREAMSKARKNSRGY